jgi:predicted esterase
MQGQDPEQAPEEVELAGGRGLAVGADDAPAIVVLCHGFAMVPGDLAPFVQSLGLGVRWLLPEAPVPAALVPGVPRGRSWWRTDPVARLEALAHGPRDMAGIEPADLPSARSLLGGILDEALARARGRPVFLGGFSSGGMLAFDLQLREPRPIAGLALFSATRICWREQAPLVAAAPLHRLPALLTHGDADDDLAFAAGEALAAAADATRVTRASATQQLPLHQEVGAVGVDAVRGVECRELGEAAPVGLRVDLLERHQLLDRLAHG